MPLNPPITDWRGKRVWLIGASSGIGRAVAALLHERGAQVCVSARQQALLDGFVRDHPGSQALAFDVTDAQASADAAKQLLAGGPLDLVCYCAGYFRPMSAQALDLPELLRHQQVNVAGALHVLAAVLPAMLQAAGAGRGAHLSLVASVAGWRGLPQSLAYGPTKAALINLAENLFLDLRPKGVGVSLVNPGFVDTPLTAQNTFPMPALLTPPQAAAAIVRGWEKGAFEMHFPKRFTRVLRLLRCLPYRWYFSIVHRVTGL
ncbi:SDR family NAD(P)-dependent oxidoreductase [Bordetella avium]|uniref:SDR family NAD(P)-dependent oxidoreductase n=1 Tax=Bordetella avium TaxID=521 RepID=UPI00031A3246|nr:SDR family NAD(P)-dependent oxidoreductase [Bordetella avium]AZY49393.1 KR domain-containing protein [Bordetella avium]RIQ12089.1 SDR family NAD(P)-dependent oxidoreductase [Bordetella avium]RIQ19093.1 SDR family NAD(P)-dependent oxidoreductase [Bordetella avium]RIQ32003.1 SDR family NAD(P)-dependent oxidoreductase [Bordetella avium]RIQ38045.1 SDR family NAD(P)-dependent oxidoreductase [Bordetella avium]